MAPEARGAPTYDGPVSTAELPAAVLWDMDGTIIDTEPFWMAEETALVEAAGGRWTRADAEDLVGSELLRSARLILDRTPVTGSPQQVVDRLVAGVIARVRAEQPWRPGSVELLAELSSLGVPSALVTMSWTELADVVVEGLPPGTFSTVVTGDQVTRGKPHPEPYLVAASRLGVDPRRCVALEDSPTGAASATAAGVPTLGVPNVVPIPPRPGMRLLGSLAGVRARDLVALARDVHVEPAAGG